MMEMKVVLCQVIRKFSFIDVGHKLDLAFEIGLHSNNGIIVEIEPRIQA